MRTLVILLLVLSGGISAYGQSDEIMPGRVLVLIHADEAARIEEMFRPIVESPDFKDPQSLALRDVDAIRSLFALPSDVNVTSLRPRIPQHSIANQNLRQSLNPVLWYRTNNVRILETPEIAALRKAEDRLSRWLELRFDGDVSPESVVRFVLKSGTAEEAEPRYKHQLLYRPNDSLLYQQYSLNLMNMPGAWDIVRGDSSIVVANIDNGTDWNHPDLRNAIKTNYGETGTDQDGYDKRANGIDDDGNGFIDDWHGWDFGGWDDETPDNDPSPRFNSHGTHTAGIIAASGDNVTGIAGIAYGVKLIPIKASDDGGGSISYGYDGIVYAADMGALVSNNSWGGSSRSSSEQDIVDYATAKNCAVVAASGNEGQNKNFYPASYRNVLSVGANEINGNFAALANYGIRLDLSAPGLQVFSTIPNGLYNWSSGTSMSSPNAAGALALVRKQYPHYTPAQAIERLRATTTPVEGPDANRTDLMGHGRVNLARAVSDTIAYSARIENVEILDDDNNHFLSSGESATLVMNVRNYLAPLKALSATLTVVKGDKFITLHKNQLDFGEVNTLDVVQNLNDQFRITCNDSTPVNAEIIVKVTFYDNKVGYGPDIDYFVFSVNPSYLDLDTNNITVSIDSKGGLGFNDPPENSQGSGFEWTNAPESISLKGRNILWLSGLMIGYSATNVVSAAPDEGFGASQDFRPVTPIRYVEPSDNPRAMQQLAVKFDDSAAFLNVQVGVEVSQRAYAFVKGLAANAIVIDYVLRKDPVTSGSVPTDSTSVALYADWDIGLSGANNSAWLLDDSTAVVRRNEAGYPLVGIKLISEKPLGSAIQHYAIDNNGSNGSVSTYGGFSRSEKWVTLNTQRHTAGPGDVAQVYGLNHLPMRSQDSIRLTLVIALAEDEALLKQTIDETAKEWFGTTSVRRDPTMLQSTIYPNPVKDILSIPLYMPFKGRYTITFSDILGSEKGVVHTSSLQNINIRSLHLSPGVYTVIVRDDNTIISNEVIVKE